MNTFPLVSVVMPVYNTAPFLRQAIDSILRQTYINFEFIIVDDASTDDSLDIIRSYRDTRIYLISNEVNQGISKTRNLGMQQAKGKYIAVFDSDDIAFSTRLEKQVEYLEKHDDFGLVGGEVLPIDSCGNVIGPTWKYPARPEEIPVLLLFRNYFAQAAVMLRVNSLPASLYDPTFITAGDYELWTRIARKVKVWNIPSPVLKYRVHQSSITRRHDKQSSTKSIVKIIKNQLSYLQMNLSEEELELMKLMSTNSYDSNLTVLRKAFKEDIQLLNQQIRVLEKVKKANNHRKVYDLHACDDIIESKKVDIIKIYIDEVFTKSYKRCLCNLVPFCRSPHKLYRYIGMRRSIRIVAKCLLGSVLKFGTK
ncbi:glycosyltransferase [Tunicatimonas pelagia]|uniref:glycosyltransferase n=1 Tax=Tunicatimonas pelagia TaxID=931531 RepID=UPI0026669B00|nr:glycosyltransferase [Tunicatimonas pelagia]WKN40720.1 glycosyltransferase [Tunicatimonas pelagia]